MKTVGVTVIGDKDIYLAGLVATLQASRFRNVRVLAIQDRLPATSSTSTSGLFIVIEPKSQSERTRGVVTSLRHRFASAAIIVVPQEDHYQWTEDDGLDACLPRSISSHALLLALELLLCREVCVGRWPNSQSEGAESARGAPLQMPAHAGGSTLSMREQEILSCIARGESNKAIAKVLSIEEATVKAHVRTVLRKTGASNRTQAAMRAHAWLDSPHTSSRHGAN